MTLVRQLSQLFLVLSNNSTPSKATTLYPSMVPFRTSLFWIDVLIMLWWRVWILAISISFRLSRIASILGNLIFLGTILLKSLCSSQSSNWLKLRIFNMKPISNVKAIALVVILGLVRLSLNFFIFPPISYTLERYWSNFLKYPLLNYNLSFRYVIIGI